MSALASSAALMSDWCPLWKEEQEPCCPATGEGCWRRSSSVVATSRKDRHSIIKEPQDEERLNATIGNGQNG